MFKVHIVITEEPIKANLPNSKLRKYGFKAFVSISGHSEHTLCACALKVSAYAPISW